MTTDERSALYENRHGHSHGCGPWCPQCVDKVLARKTEQKAAVVTAVFSGPPVDVKVNTMMRRGRVQRPSDLGPVAPRQRGLSRRAPHEDPSGQRGA